MNYEQSHHLLASHIYLSSPFLMHGIIFLKTNLYGLYGTTCSCVRREEQLRGEQYA